ncbi:SDR family oxidoreductase [Nocardia sp. FBN12]|uniref:SDR family oxidoreductase n=1 Tax=Nocardia sp. FBN12 TaxID=3419766 RepID=UPI003D02A16C
MQPLAGRTAFITGGANGIGLGIARACARQGAKIAIADTDREALEAAKGDLVALTEAEAYHLDVRDRDAFERTADKVEQALGPVTLLFNNAGVSDSTSPRKMNFRAWDWVMDVNLNGVYNGIQTFVPRMLDRGHRGHIVNTASVAGHIVAGSGFLYHTSKFAVVGLTESLDAELDSYGIGASVLCPGQVATNIVNNTIRMRPDGTPPHSAKVAAILADVQQQLNDRGADPDVVGEMVLAGIERDSLYIFTDDNYLPLIHRRTAAIVQAMADVGANSARQ